MKKRLLMFQAASVALCVGFGTYTVVNHVTSAQPSVQAPVQAPVQPSNTVNALANHFASWHSYDVPQSDAQIQEQLQQQIQQQEQQIQQEVERWQQQVNQLQQQAESGQQQQTNPQSQPDAQQGNQSTSSAVSLPANTQASGNWAGYIASPASRSDSYTSVTGSWTVPNITGSQDGVAAQWIGLGGVSSNDLLQMGTIEQFVNGQAVANVFWEKLPASAQNIMTVPIGSTINASISKATGSTWNITFTAHTPAGQTETKTILVTLNTSYARGIGTSAEWISEDPSDENNNLYPLADMGTVSYASTTVDGQPLNAAGNQIQPVALVDNGGNVLIAPSALGTDGTSFSTASVSAGTTLSGQAGQGSGRSGHHGRYHHLGGHSSGFTDFGSGYGFSRW
ncbi:G1 family glutamic endopeptidase [Alicyclobacillus dauci]|uniref:Peptidase A4 family protein n=1 Tax=Alicyclobacillus dauci TaxID=1475485 RepID=A0ABY6Z750_9BACL|nr:G1 family glutamic endopeptidase [Alicyclobacillus dauci]WAH37835.1 hypothetical protein NZD86_04835 [Alicyclobacillus dauci]